MVSIRIATADGFDPLDDVNFAETMTRDDMEELEAIDSTSDPIAPLTDQDLLQEPLSKRQKLGGDRGRGERGQGGSCCSCHKSRGLSSYWNFMKLCSAARTECCMG